MSIDTQPPYEPSTYFEQQNGLYGNHFRFTLEALPDLTFFAQEVTIPSISLPRVDRSNPFTKIAEVGDHFDYGALTVEYLIDGAFKTYSSLYWWLKGYGFPHTYDEVKEFRETRAKRVWTPNPQVKDLEKTNAVLYLLQPDTEKIVAQFHFTDVFPTAISDLKFSTMDGDVPILKSTATFAFTHFELALV